MSRPPRQTATSRLFGPGVLAVSIGLERQLPEALKPRTIPIASGADALIEAKATKKTKSA